MKISGRLIADVIKQELAKEVSFFILKGIVPQIAIITLGDESAWATYVNQKLKVAKTLGINAVHYNLENKPQRDLLSLIQKLNKDKKTYGIIVQRPLPPYIDQATVVDMIQREKDVDGFRKDSLFQVPVFLAVNRILEDIANKDNKSLKKFLSIKSIAVIGKGVTAGMPIIKGLEHLYHIKPIVIDSRTENVSGILQQSDIVISAVGDEILTKDNIKPGAVVIGVGIRVEDGKAKGDYDAEEIAQKASYYTSTPGGIGPLNLTFLFQNLIKSVKIQTQE